MTRPAESIGYVGRIRKVVVPTLITGVALFYSACGGGNGDSKPPTATYERPTAAASATPYKTDTPQPTAVPATDTPEYKHGIEKIEFSHQRPDIEQTLTLYREAMYFDEIDHISDPDVLTRSCAKSYGEITLDTLAGYIKGDLLPVYGTGNKDTGWKLKITREDG